MAHRLQSLRSAKGWILSAAAILSLSLTACSERYDNSIPTSQISDDYQKNHPIVLENAPHKLDIFLVGADGRLDGRQQAELRNFAASFRSQGQGRIRVMLPMIANHGVVQKTFAAIRSSFARAGLRGSLLVGQYPVDNPRLASPIELSFLKLKAVVPTPCGQWPHDLASGSSFDGMENKPYYNFGCATQKDFAMQVADPRDLVRARPETPSDVNMRLRAIGNIEQGVDPGTNWVTNNTTISSVGAN